MLPIVLRCVCKRILKDDEYNVDDHLFRFSSKTEGSATPLGRSSEDCQICVDHSRRFYSQQTSGKEIRWLAYKYDVVHASYSDA